MCIRDRGHVSEGARRHAGPGPRREGQPVLSRQLPSGSHAHVDAGSAPDERRLKLALALIVGFLAFEVVMAVVARSLALLADAGHMLTDASAIGASLFALRLARRPASGSHTFGFKRAEILSAQGNGITLLVVAVLVGIESVRRLIHPPVVRGGVLVVVAAIGVLVNLAATQVLAGADRRSLNTVSYTHLRAHETRHDL